MTWQTNNMSEMRADITTFKFQNLIAQAQLKVLLSEAELRNKLQSLQGLCHHRALLRPCDADYPRGKHSGRLR